MSEITADLATPDVAGHDRVDLAGRWCTVRPKGSSAEFDRPESARPSFTPDVPGTYGYKLVAELQGARAEHTGFVTVYSEDEE